MKITNIETFALVWPSLDKTFWVSTGPISRVSELVVKVYTDEGIVGIGEGHGNVNIGLQVEAESPKRMTGAAIIVDEGLKRLLIGEDPLNNERLWSKMFSITYNKGWRIPGWPRPQIMMAIAAVDSALWDIKGKTAGIPIWKLLGGSSSCCPCYVTGGYYQEGKTIVDLVKECEGYLNLGYTGIKIKVGGLEVKEDIKRVKAVREAIGPDVKLMLDANEGWDVLTAIRAAQAFEEFDIYWLEEPVHWYDNVDGLAKVAASTRLPIASGEQLVTRWGARDLIERGGISIMQFDCTRAAGPTEWLKVAGMANSHHVQMAPHHDPQIHGHLCASVPNGLILETFPDPTRDPIWGELFTVRPEIKNSEIVFPEDRPGWGLELDEKVMQKRAVKVT